MLINEVKVGDYVWNVRHGWEKIQFMDTNSCYPIVTESETFTGDGKCYYEDKYPSIFKEPPVDYAEPKPCEFKKGDRVLAWEFKNQIPCKRYFSHIDKDGYYCCFENGTDEWTSNGRVTKWSNCKKWGAE